jgi:hypothetical protein
VLETIGALTTSHDSERLHRAATQYHDALRNWRPGFETRAIAPLWMAVEALTDVALRAELHPRGLDERGLAAAWGIALDGPVREWRQELTAQVRRRLIFQGDDETYSRAKKASDGWEHGFLPFDVIRTLAEGSRDKTARYVRDAFFRLIGLPAASLARLEASPIGAPRQHFPYARYMKGWLVGTAENPGRAELGFAVADWTWQLKEFEAVDDDRRYTASFEDKVTPVVADDVGLKVERFEVWGPASDELEA